LKKQIMKSTQTLVLLLLLMLLPVWSVHAKHQTDAIFGTAVLSTKKMKTDGKIRKEEVILTITSPMSYNGFRLICKMVANQKFKKDKDLLKLARIDLKIESLKNPMTDEETPIKALICGLDNDFGSGIAIDNSQKFEDRPQLRGSTGGKSKSATVFRDCTPCSQKVDKPNGGLVSTFWKPKGGFKIKENQKFTISLCEEGTPWKSF
jgi:hypothetical protein